jgi:hypothetical protein
LKSEGEKPLSENTPHNNKAMSDNKTSSGKPARLADRRAFSRMALLPKTPAQEPVFLPKVKT